MITYTLTKRKTKDGVNIEFKSIDRDNNDKAYSGSTELYVKCLKNNTCKIDVQDSDGSYTEVTVEKIGEKEFLKSKSNDGKLDNVDSLPTF